MINIHNFRQDFANKKKNTLFLIPNPTKGTEILQQNLK